MPHLVIPNVNKISHYSGAGQTNWEKMTSPSDKLTALACHPNKNQEILKGKYHCTIELLFDWFGLVCLANKKKKCQLSYS